MLNFAIYGYLSLFKDNTSTIKRNLDHDYFVVLRNIELCTLLWVPFVLSIILVSL